MRKSRWREYSYTILLSVSFCLAVLLWQFGGLKDQKPGEVSHFLEDATNDFLSWILLERSVEAVSAEVSGEELPDGLEEQDVLSQAMSAPEAEDVGVETADKDMAAGKTETESGVENGKADAAAVPEFYHADISYFDDALFIGDSRTVGLYEYGGLGNAEVFAHSGMSIYKIFKEEFELRSGEKVTLEQALQTRQFGKVYIMLGINELGYDFDQTVERFGEAVALIRELQPQALIFIQANLHITKAKSEESELFNNTNIDEFNRAVGELADGKNIFYLDVNPLYDDEEGALSEEFTTDHAHILGKYYVDWVDFILQNAVKVQEAEELKQSA